jgi:hypothetical protein
MLDLVVDWALKRLRRDGLDAHAGKDGGQRVLDFENEDACLTAQRLLFQETEGERPFKLRLSPRPLGVQILAAT